MKEYGFTNCPFIITDWLAYEHMTTPTVDHCIGRFTMLIIIFQSAKKPVRYPEEHVKHRINVLKSYKRNFLCHSIVLTVVNLLLAMESLYSIFKIEGLERRLSGS